MGCRHGWLAGFGLSVLMCSCSLVFDRAAADEGARSAFDAGSGQPDAAPFDASTSCFRLEMGCPPDFVGTVESQPWEFFAGGCSCYLATNLFQSAARAAETCRGFVHEGRSAHLLNLEDPGEAEFVSDRSNLAARPATQAEELLLGLFYVDDQWTWQTGELLDLAEFTAEMQGIVTPPQEGCVKIVHDPSYGWVSQACNPTEKPEVVCEIDGRSESVATPD